MPATRYGGDFSANYPVIQANDIKFESLKNFFWGKWAKFNTYKQRAVGWKGAEPMPISSPIVIQNELKRKAGDLIEIPILRNLVNLPKEGNEQAEGFEEDIAINFMAVPVELLRHPVKVQEGLMSHQIDKEMKIYEKAKPSLLRHYSRVSETRGVTAAFYKGFSENVLNTGRFTARSTKVAETSHPHIFCPGSGKVSYSSGYPGNSGYEGAVATAIDGILASNVFDTHFLRYVKTDPAVMKIPKIIMKDGRSFWMIVAHPWQIAQLAADPEFKSTVSSALAQSYAKDNPLLVGCNYIYEGFAIFESDTAVWPVSTSGGAPVWGFSTVTNMSTYEDYSSGTKFGAILVGDNAIYKAMGSGMEFIPDNRDYNEIKGLVYRIIEGYARADFRNRDDGSTGTNWVNESSAILITHAQRPGA